MLRKARQQQQHNRKAKQQNATRPKQSFFKEKLAAMHTLNAVHMHTCAQFMHIQCHEYCSFLQKVFPSPTERRYCMYICTDVCTSHVHVHV